MPHATLIFTDGDESAGGARNPGSFIAAYCTGEKAARRVNRGAGWDGEKDSPTLCVWLRFLR